MSRHLTYANVMATLALFIALGGGALAVSKVGSSQIRNGSVKSIDLQNHGAVQNRDVKENGLRGNAIAEGTLDASRFVSVEGDEDTDCHPTSPTDFVDCVKVTISLRTTARLLAIVTGNEQSVGGPAAANCEIRIDGETVSSPFSPGESTTSNTDATATDGFARTVVTRDAVRPGRHKVSLACARFSGDVKIARPTIALLAISQG